MLKTDLSLEGLIHDLNNVFQTIGESSELLQSDPKWARVAGTLQRCVEHGQRLARSILDTRRSSAEAAGVIDSAIQFTRDFLESAHRPVLDIRCDVDPELWIEGDPGAWERVITNLLVNAAEAGGTRVDVVARDGAIVVSDNGRGIRPELLPRIFQPHVSTKSIWSGLGLYIVQSIVEQHGGEVTASNLPGSGAEFRIRLASGG